MPDVDLLAILAATVAAFAAGAALDAAHGGRLARVSEAAAAAGQPSPWELAAELLRCLVLAAVVAGLASQGGIAAWTGGLALGLALWAGFPLVLWTGAILHERAPFGLAAIHAGDWLVKLPLIGVIVSVVQ
jgi:hypothetical protein